MDASGHQPLVLSGKRTAQGESLKAYRPLDLLQDQTPPYLVTVDGTSTGIISRVSMIQVHCCSIRYV